MARMLETIREMLQRGAPSPPIAQLIGFELTEIEPGQATIELETSERHFNPMGTVHGGVFCDIADAAMGLAYATQLEDDETYVTVEIKVNYLRPVWKSRLRAEGTVVKAGRTIGLAECTITDEEGRLVAKASSTLMTLRGDQAEGALAVRRKLDG